MDKRSVLSSNGKIIGKAKRNVQSSIINLFFTQYDLEVHFRGRAEADFFHSPPSQEHAYIVGHCHVKGKFEPILLKGVDSEQAVSSEAACTPLSVWHC